MQMNVTNENIQNINGKVWTSYIVLIAAVSSSFRQNTVNHIRENYISSCYWNMYERVYLILNWNEYLDALKDLWRKAEIISDFNRSISVLGNEIK